MKRFLLLAALLAAFPVSDAFAGKLDRTLGTSSTSDNDGANSFMARGGYVGVIKDSVRDDIFRTKEMRDLINQARDLGPEAKLELVNRFWNKIPYRSDSEVYGVSEHWAKPGEFARNGGDCEDFALAKYATLRHCGIPANKMRVLAVEDAKSGEHHAILAVYLGGRVHILDNAGTRTMSEAELASRYLPLASANEKESWKHESTGKAKKAKKVIEKREAAKARKARREARKLYFQEKY